MAAYRFILPYTPKKRGKGSPPDTPLRQLRGIGPLFSQRLQDQGFETLQDIYNYLSRPDTTRKVLKSFGKFVVILEVVNV